MGSPEAGRLLRRLLTEPGAPRRIWVARAGGRNVDDVNIAAVAQVLAEHLWESGLRDETDVDLPRSLKDRVRRAVTGAGMTDETLSWFVDAFDLTSSDRRHLEELLLGAPSTRSLAGVARAPELPVHRRYRTVSLNEHHYIGPDRCPQIHRTTQVLEGVANSFETYLYMFDTHTIDVHVVQGGRVVGPVKPISDGVYGVEIALTRPLRQGETATLTYESRFSYASPPEPEFRRAAFHGVDSVDIRVQFDTTAVPRAAYFAEWTALEDHEPHWSSPVEIEQDHAVHRFLRTMENCIVGFRWEWS